MSTSVYQLIDETNTPFYVGVTNNPKRRLQEHLRTANKNPVWHVHRKIRTILDRGENISLSILETNLTMKEAYARETQIITEFQSRGITLCNLTDGGEGGLGHKPMFTKEWKTNLSNSAKERVARLGVPFKGKTHSLETKEKMKEQKKNRDISGENNPFYGRTQSQEFKDKLARERTGKGLKQYIIYSPELEEFIVIEGLNAFCKRINQERNIQLNPASFSAVVKGKYSHHKGWTIKYLLQQDNE
jgi:group I intron endonuclease